MNLSAHVHVTWALHVELSVADRPELTRVIGVPRDAPSYWIVEAYRLSLGLDPEVLEPDDGADPPPLIDLFPWRCASQRVAIPGVADAVDVTITGPFETGMGDPRVTVVDAGPSPTEVQPMGADWQIARPPFRAEHVEFELAQRFGLVQPHLDPLPVGGTGEGLRSFSPLTTLCESLPPVRRLALLAHLDEAELSDAAPLDPTVAGAATAGLRMLVERIGSDGVQQDPSDGWFPGAVVSEVVDALDWSGTAAPDLPDPASALTLLARRTKAVRRLRGRIVVTRLGRALTNGEARAFLQIVDLVRAIGTEGLFPSGQPRRVTLALLGVADGSATGFGELAEVVARGEAAVEKGRGHGGRPFEWTLRAQREDGEGSGTESRYAAQRVAENLCALSSPGMYGSITPAMRAVARAALRYPR